MHCSVLADFSKVSEEWLLIHFSHGRPTLYGISPAVIEYWCSDSIDAITIEDVPDYELRQALVEVRWTVTNNIY